jgi:hypothetical protein
MHRKFTPKLEGLERKRLLNATHTPTPLPISTVLPVPSVAPPTVSTPPFVPGSGQPLPVEIARIRFGASFAGPFSIGPPHYTNESSRISIRGVGFSTQYIHGNLQMAIVQPKTPGSPILGGAFLQDKNLAGSNEIGLDINFDPNSLDARGRPTLGAWQTDANIYSGLDFVALGKGTVFIRYVKNNAFVLFKGTMFTNDLSNPLGNVNLQP